jgi:uncharacterized protein
MLEQKIQEDYIKAMKARDTLKSGTLSFLRAQLKNTMIDKRQEQLDDADVIAVIKRQVKQRQESITQFEQGGRLELADKERKEVDILKTYLPQEMSKEELKIIVSQMIAEIGAKGMKDMGQVMKAVGIKVAGRADNKLVSEVVKAELSSV